MTPLDQNARNYLAERKATRLAQTEADRWAVVGMCIGLGFVLAILAAYAVWQSLSIMAGVE